MQFLKLLNQADSSLGTIELSLIKGIKDLDYAVLAASLSQHSEYSI
jgi:hypothetical protein